MPIRDRTGWARAVVLVSRVLRSASQAMPWGASQLDSAAVSKVCAICGKKPSFGHNRSHSMVATKRRFDPNLQRVRLLLDGKATRAYVCTRCLKGGRVIKAV
jgi:large subunit ribosomal protein L28